MSTVAIEQDWFVDGRLVLPAGLPFAAWELVGQQLRHMETSIGWWLGDWYRYGEATYGHEFSQALPDTGYAKHTIQNMASVAAAIEPSRRREGVPFGHHAAVAGLPPDQQDVLLEEAATTDMPVQQLRAKVRHLKATEIPDPEAYCWTVACERCRQTGPCLDCRPGHMSVDRGALCQWLAGHRGHDVRLIGEEFMPPWLT